MKRGWLTCLVLFVSIACFSNSSWALVISRAGRGGDCNLIGLWDAKALTCTLNTDILVSDNNYTKLPNETSVLLSIDSAGITLDGNGHRISIPDRNHRTIIGVAIRKGKVTVKNLTIENYYVGIQVSGGWVVSNIAILDNIVRHNASGIAGGMEESNISGNSIYLNGHPIELSSYRSIISGNNISNNSDKFYLFGRCGSGDRRTGSCGVEGENTITDNIISFNLRKGLEIFGTNNTISGNTFLSNAEFQLSSNSPDVDRPNRIFHNNFIADNNEVILEGYNVLNLEMPTGGNYWSDFDTPEKGCSDSNGDGLCDISKIITGSYFDDLPWTKQNGWLGTAQP